MTKITVMYGHPTSSEEFEKYYSTTHLPLAATMNDVVRIELTKFISGPDGTKPASYRMAELYFATRQEMEQTLASPEGKATVADLAKFATGGVTVLIGAVGP